MEIWQIVLLGVYTLAYIIVIIIQQKRIDSMKTFMDIFDLDKVKKYVEMSEETVKMQVNNLLANDEKIYEISKEVINEQVDKIKQFYNDSLQNKNVEMAKALVKLLKDNTEEENQSFADKNLPIMKEIILKGVKSYDNIFNDENSD